MRFGKRLAEITAGRGAQEPYVSYKDLKHTVSKLSGLLGASPGGDGDAGSSGDEADGQPAGPLPSMASTGEAALRLEAFQREFFGRVDADVALAKAYVQNVVAALEAQVGDWQASAIAEGILFTPEQLEEVSGHLPFHVEEQQVLVEWLIGLRSAEKRPAARSRLLEKYSEFADSLNGLLRYIEVNLTAIRKIFKKFEKKIPLDVRIQNVRDYKAHHDLYMPAMQDLLVTAVHIQRLVFNIIAPSHGAGSTGPEPAAVAISQIGSESLALLSWLRGPAALDDVLSGGATTPIDVYAKPAADIGNPCVAGVATAGRAATSGSSPGDTAAGYPSPPDAMVQRGAAASGQDVLGAAVAAAAMSGKKGSFANVACTGVAAARSETRQDAVQEEEALRPGRRRGGRGSRGGGRGRRAMGTQPAQGGAPAASRGHLQGGACEERSALPVHVAASMGSTQGMGFWSAAGAVPQPVFAPFPVHASKAEGCRRAQGSMVGRGGGRGACGGKGMAATGHNPYATATGSQQGVVPTMDPHWFAAMMPMFWQPSAAMLPMDGVSQQGAGGRPQPKGHGV